LLLACVAVDNLARTVDHSEQLHPRLSKYNNFGYILTSLFMDSSRFKNRLELIEKRC
jgi:hypothetical protein